MKTNTRTTPVLTHEGARAQRISPELELRRSLMTCLLWEDTFYEKGSEIAERIADLIKRVEPEKVARLAIEARSSMQLRHAPLFVVRELARKKGNGALVAGLLPQVIQRADELSEFLAMYWKDGKCPVSAGVKRGLATAFRKFSAYQLAKYNRDETVKLRDVLFQCHAKPRDLEQAAVWKRLVDKTLESPDTWEVALSSGKDKKETWERLLSEKKLGGLALLRNLRNMQAANVDETLIRSALAEGAARALPFRFVTAARFAPRLEDAIEKAMFKALEETENLSGKTVLLVDVSGSMDEKLNARTETSRIDAACGLAILLREKFDYVAPDIWTFSHRAVNVPPRRGFALRDAINDSQSHGGTYLANALKELKQFSSDRMIVITDEQSHDGIIPAWIAKSYVINVAPYKNGISYGNGWTHIDGWSERVIDYIRLSEEMEG